MIEGQNSTARGRLARIGWRSAAVAAAAGVTGIGAVVVLGDPGPQAPFYAVGDSQDAPAPAADNPLRAELARCRTLPEGTDDARCRAAWEASRQQFMGESPGFAAPAEPTPVPGPTPSPVAPSADGSAAEG